VTVLIAKLFTGLAGIVFVVAILGRVRILPHPNLLLWAGNTAYGPFYWQLFIALVCVGFGFAYFGFVRLTQRPLNQTAGLTGFFLVAFASVVWLISSFLTTKVSRMSRSMVILIFVAAFSFMLGVVLSAANLAWIFLRRIGNGVTAS
jgi:hypothetical protein